MWSYTSTPPISLHGVVLRHNFTFTCILCGTTVGLSRHNADSHDEITGKISWDGSVK
jgi:hypothetical protein